MTQLNKAFKGRINLKHLEDGKYIPEIVDSDGNVIEGSNDSNIILAKYAIMMSIIKSRGRLSKNYCLIIDAPTSKMADEYSIGFFETLSKEFNQSIVMTSYFLDETKLQQIDQARLGTIYNLEAVHLSSDPDDRTEMYINTKRVA